MAQSIGTMLGASWASGVNLYLTVAGLGIFQHMHWISLPGSLNRLAHPLVILSAIVLYMIEFIADKIPIIDHLWDTIHTFIRPVGGAVLGYLSAVHLGPVAQTLVGLTTGSIAASSHLTKATSRVAVNSSLIPGAGIMASVAGDTSVGGMLYLILKHPIIAGLIVVAFVIFAVWFLRKMFGLVKKIFSFSLHRESAVSG